jgi:hypothetical protein
MFPTFEIAHRPFSVACPTPDLACNSLRGLPSNNRRGLHVAINCGNTTATLGLSISRNSQVILPVLLFMTCINTEQEVSISH